MSRGGEDVLKNVWQLAREAQAYARHLVMALQAKQRMTAAPCPLLSPRDTGWGAPHSTK